MIRFFASITLILSIFNTIGSGLDGVFENGDKQEIAKHSYFDGPTLSALNHDCSSDSNHHEEGPCSGDCHHHGHCHCSFISSTTKLSCPSQDANQGISRNQFHLSSYLENPFRPPIA